MSKRLIYSLTVLALLGALGAGYAWRAAAESAAKRVDRPLKGEGTPGQLARWTGADTIGNSVMTEDANGLIAVGTAPNGLAKFLVVGTFDTPNSAIRGINNGPGRGVTGISENGIGLNGGGKIGVNGVTTGTDPND